MLNYPIFWSAKADFQAVIPPNKFIGDANPKVFNNKQASLLRTPPLQNNTISSSFHCSIDSISIYLILLNGNKGVFRLYSSYSPSSRTSMTFKFGFCFNKAWSSSTLISFIMYVLNTTQR